MKLICPSCGATHSADAWLSDAVVRQCLIIAGSMQHDIGSRCFAYLSLFRPRGKALQWKKVLRLLSELKALSTAAQVEWKNQPARPNIREAWALAIEKLLDNPPARLPLTSHGYLRSMAYEIADEMDRQAEVKKNQIERQGAGIRDRRAGIRGQGSVVREQEPEKMSFEEMKKITNENYRNRKRQSVK